MSETLWWMIGLCAMALVGGIGVGFNIGRIYERSEVGMLGEMRRAKEEKAR